MHIRFAGLSAQFGRSSLSIAAAALFGVLAPACVTAPTDMDQSVRVQGAYQSPLSGTACASEDDDSAAAREAVARVRALAGLPALACDQAAARAATLHCEYQIANHVLTHVQTPGLPHFTGVNFWDRLAREHFTLDPSAEVVSTLTGALAIDDPRGLMNSVYHRAPFLRSENTVLGYGHANACATIDFGRPDAKHRPAPVRVVWPPNGATNAPIEFRADHETPNPLPGSTTVGAPVSVVTTELFEDVSATLEGPEGPVDGVTITHETDGAHLVRPGEVHFVPRARLAADTEYRFSFRGELDNGVVKLTSKFTTGSR